MTEIRLAQYFDLLDASGIRHRYQNYFVQEAKAIRASAMSLHHSALMAAPPTSMAITRSSAYCFPTWSSPSGWLRTVTATASAS
jgi:hypothetical protein